MRGIFNIPDATYEILKPILEQYKVQSEERQDDNTPLDWEVIVALPCGVRITNVLRDGQWKNCYSVHFKGYLKELSYSILTVGDLRKITKVEFLKHRNAGAKCWESLSKYIKTLE